MLSSVIVHRIVVAVLIGGLLIAASPVTLAQTDSTFSEPLIGAWDVVTEFDGQQPLPGLISFLDGGVVLTTAIGGVSGQGVWQVGSGTDYYFTWVQLIADAQGNSVGRNLIRGVVTVDGDVLRGQLQGEAMNPQGEVTFTATGSIEAARMLIPDF